MAKRINPRLIEIAQRHRDEKFLEREVEKAEQARKLFEEQRSRDQSEIVRKRRENLERAGLDEARKKELESYIKTLNNFRGNELEIAMYAFTQHPNFSIIHNQLETILRSHDKWAFILRSAYGVGEETELFVGDIFQSNPIEDYGIYLLCPYFRENESSVTREECLIDSEPVMSCCQGEYDICAVFEDRAKKAAVGMINLPVINRTNPKFTVPTINVEPIDLKDLDDWWKMEGKYE